MSAEAATTPEVNLNDGATTATVSTDPVQPAPTGDEVLLAGKFKTQADLENAYKELEKKLGQSKPQQPDQQQQQEQTDTGEESEDKTKEGENEGDPDPLVEIYGETVGNALKEAGVDAAKVQSEFDETGTLSDESFEQFAKAGYPKEMVEAYMRGLQQSNDQTVAITETQIGQIKQVAGGDEGYEKMTEWMGANLSDEDLNKFNETINTGDFNAVLSAVSEMNNRFKTEMGTEGKLLGGKTPAADGGYANEAEYLEAVAKPEYKTSQAYRDQVRAKLAKSPNVFVTR